jgi:hypothetical protein
MSKEVALPKERKTTKQQMYVLEAWRDYRQVYWDNHNDSPDISQPHMPDENSVAFKFEGLGLLAHGLLKLVDFLKYLETHYPKYSPNKCTVYLRMNGKLFPALAGDDEEICKATVERVNEEASAAYRLTPEYAASQAKMENSKREAAENMKQVLRDLRPDFDYLDMGRWLIRYIAGQDRIGADVDIAEMYTRFENMGYIRNEGVTVPTTRPVGLEANIRYIVGQVMSFHNPEDPDSGFGPCTAHPMLGEWAEKAVREHLETSIETTKEEKLENE